MARLRFVTLNAWGGRCWPALDAWLPRCEADVLGLQEVTRAPLRAPPWLRYVDPSRTLDQRSDLFGDVSAALPAYQPCFAPATRGALIDPNGREWASEHGIATWVAPHLAVTERWQGFVHGAYRHDGWGPEPVPRTFQAMRVVEPTTGRSVLLAHLHGLRDPMGKGDTPARAAQARRIADVVAGIAAPDEPVALGGDLNLLPGSETFDILAGIGLTDLVVARGIADTRTPLYAKPERHANYMLVNDRVRVVAFDALAEPVVSDHRPLVLDLEV